jgi:hypothetical protein
VDCMVKKGLKIVHDWNHLNRDKDFHCVACRDPFVEEERKYSACYFRSL